MDNTSRLTVEASRLKSRRNHRVTLHGDISSGDGRAFCKACTRYDAPAHFECHGIAANLKLYQDGVAALELLNRSARVILGTRKNLFAAGKVRTPRGKR